jgi:hypothetical protein
MRDKTVAAITRVTYFGAPDRPEWVPGDVWLTVQGELLLQRIFEMQNHEGEAGQ